MTNVTDDLYRFSTALEVRWRDVDALGHVNNAVYFNYLEQARLHYMRELGFLPPNSTDVGVIIAEAS
jgi:acyl-CoA thioester hydrolase